MVKLKSNNLEDNMKFLVINGPNINMLGTREPKIYGSTTMNDINQELIEYSKTIAQDIVLEFYQSNHEGEIVDKIQTLKDYDGLIINPAAYTHTSVAIRDALLAVQIPTIEVHISDLSKREDFRQISYVALAAIKTIKGHGFNGYLEAIDELIK